MMVEQLSESEIVQRREGEMIPDQHLASLARTIRVSKMVGRELSVNVVPTETDITDLPGVYLIEGSVNTDDYQEITGTHFEFSRVTLSGRADSAHPVLPGNLTVTYSERS